MKTKNILHHKGIVSILFVLLMAIIATFILIIGQSRILLAIQRGKSMSDILIGTYHAESKLNDLILKLAKNTINKNDLGTSTLADGTTLDITEKKKGNERTITITATRPFAVSGLEAIQDFTPGKSIDSLELILNIDCTGSMNYYDPPNQSQYTLFDREKIAAMHFIDLLIDQKQKDPAKTIKLGLAAFKIDARWIINPTEDLGLVRSSVDAGMKSDTRVSSACVGLLENTSIGSAFVLSNSYFRTVEKDPNTKQAVVTISDGRVNASEPNVQCGSFYCPYTWTCTPPNGWQCTRDSSGKYIQGDACRPYALDFLRCSLDSTGLGDRDPKTDAYMVTVLADYSQIGAEEQIFNKYATKYYNTTRGDDLASILEYIFQDITAGFTKTTIKKITPQ